jgi:uncharacterized protein (DUF58 family)
VTPAELLREVRRIELTTRELVRDLVAGDYASTFRGRGVEFAEVREYLPGDDIRTIDWNVTARLGTPYVKRFHEERQLSLLLLLDVSASHAFGSRERTRRGLAAELCAVLALAATRHRDRVGAAFYSDRVEWFSPPRRGRRQALSVVSQALAFEPAGRGTDLPGALAFLDPLLRRRGAVVVISDFLDPTQWPALDRLAHRHDVMALQLTDPRERELPAVGLVTLVDPETGEWRVIDTDLPEVRDRFRASRVAFDNALAAHCAREGIDLLRLDTDQPWGDRLAAFFSRRDRRAAW